MKNFNIKIKLILFLTAALLLFGSCFGASFDIQMNRDGSGRLTMEFRVSHMLNNLGALDGNEFMPPVPLSREDMERSIQNISGMRLVSYSSRSTQLDNITTAILEFSNPRALLAFLDSTGERVSITHNGDTGSFNLLIFPERESGYDQNAMILMRSFFDGYNFSISFSARGNSAIAFVNASGAAIPAPSSATVSAAGNRVSFTLPILDVITITDGLGIQITWR